MTASLAQTVPLVVSPQPGTLVEFAGTFVLGALFFSLTAHVAARYVLGDVPPKRALAVGVVLAFVTLALGRLPTVVIIVVAVAADFLAIRSVYRLDYRTTGLVAIVHYTVTVLSSIAIANGLAFLADAPI